MFRTCLSTAFLALPASEGEKFLKESHSILTKIVRGRRAKDCREGKREVGRQEGEEAKDANFDQTRDKHGRRAGEKSHVIGKDFASLMPTLLRNHGSTARDHCMLERNFLSHARLGLVLMLLTSSVLLKARLPGPDRPKDHEDHPNHGLGIPLASIQVAAALIVIGAGCWEYESGIRDMYARRAFLLSNE